MDWWFRIVFSCGSQVDDELADIDLTDPELNKAATKIQASFRGHKVRKVGNPKEGEEEEGDEAAGQWAMAAARLRQDSSPWTTNAMPEPAGVM